MHATPLSAFRCHHCGELVRVASRSLNEPGRYTCGHQDKTADLTVDDWSGLVSGSSNYLPAATASPLMAGERVLDYDRWLREDAQQGVRALLARIRLSGAEPPPITDVS